MPPQGNAHHDIHLMNREQSRLGAGTDTATFALNLTNTPLKADAAAPLSTPIFRPEVASTI